MKKITLCSIILASQLFGAYNELEVFKKGFTVGLEAVDYQLNHEGFEPKQIEITSPYAVVWEIEKVQTRDILYLQHLLNRDGIESYILKDFLLVSTFDRLADAKALAKKINSMYGVVLKIKELEMGMVETYPILFASKTKELTDSFLQRQRKVYVTPLQLKLAKGEITLNDIPMNKPRYKADKNKKFKLKNNAIAYEYNIKADKKLNCGGAYKNGNCYLAHNFSSISEVKKGTEYILGGVYLRSDGVKMQKVLNKNIFFFLDDVEGGEE